jgi:hypothetical protein
MPYLFNFVNSSEWEQMLNISFTVCLPWRIRFLQPEAEGPVEPVLEKRAMMGFAGLFPREEYVG